MSAYPGPSPSPEAGAYEQREARDGDSAGALRTAERLVRSARNTLTSDYIYGALATGQAEAGDSEAALRTVALINGYPPQPEMWRALGRAEGRRGNVDAVLARGPQGGNRLAAADRPGRGTGRPRRRASALEVIRSLPEG
jgi:hypothetical protein